jgi:hypothetical protein
MEPKPSPRSARKALRRLVIVVVSAAVALIALELAIRVWVPVRNVGPTFTRYDPALGKRLKSDLAAVRITPEFTMRLTTNSRGWRGPEFAPRAAGSIVCLGDSFTLGYGVNDGQEFPRVLEGRLAAELGSGTPAVVNLGIGASGTGKWLKLLRRGEVQAFDPRLVVLQVCSNDWDDDLNERLFTLRADGGLDELPVPPPKWTRRVQELVEAIPFADDTWMVGLLRQCFERTPPSHEPTGEEVAAPTPAQPDLTLALIAASIEECRAHGWNVLLLAADLEGRHLDEIRALAQRQGLPFFAAPAPKDRREIYYRVDRHWNASGHAFVGSALAEQVLGSSALMKTSGGTRG